jgi:hypothetical protein
MAPKRKQNKPQGAKEVKPGVQHTRVRTSLSDSRSGHLAVVKGWIGKEAHYQQLKPPNPNDNHPGEGKAILFVRGDQAGNQT